MMTGKTRTPSSLRRQIRPLFSPLRPLWGAIFYINSSRAEASRVECTDWVPDPKRALAKCSGVPSEQKEDGDNDSYPNGTQPYHLSEVHSHIFRAPTLRLTVNLKARLQIVLVQPVIRHVPSWFSGYLTSE